MGEIEKQIAELKSLAEMDMLPQDTKAEIEMAIKLAEQVKEYDQDGGDLKNKTKINYINKSNNKNPSYVKEGDSGFDLRANESGTLKPFERLLVPTGLFFELPEGYELQIRPRSGLAFKHGITVLNTPGTVDTGYRGEIKVLLINLGQDKFTFEKGDRVAQGVIAGRVSSDLGELVEVLNLNESDRGDSGFGSTGSK